MIPEEKLVIRSASCAGQLLACRRSQGVFCTTQFQNHNCICHLLPPDKDPDADKPIHRALRGNNSTLQPVKIQSRTEARDKGRRNLVRTLQAAKPARPAVMLGGTTINCTVLLSIPTPDLQAVLTVIKPLCTLVGGVSGGSQSATGCERQEGVPCRAPSAWSLGAMLGSPTCSASSASLSTCRQPHRSATSHYFWTAALLFQPQTIVLQPKWFMAGCYLQNANSFICRQQEHLRPCALQKNNLHSR